MKKSIVALVILSIFCIASVAFAAGGPFSDVPAKHWAYDAVSKLAKAGILNGYGDGAFSGDKPMTRYEMAIVVGKAMEKEDKANQEQKAIIDKLAAEFGKELENLGVRVKALEDKNANALKINGYARFRYDWGSQSSPANRNFLPYYSNYPTNNGHTQVSNILFLDKQFDAQNYAHTTIGALVNSGPGESNWQLFEGYYGHREGTSELKVGRMLASLGNGFLFQNCYSDGVALTFGAGTDLTTSLYAITHANLDWLAGEVKAKVNKDTSLWVGHIVDRKSDEDSPSLWDRVMGHAKTTAAGFKYTGIPDITLTGAYGVNAAAVAKNVNNGSNARGMFVQAKYKGANPGVVGSTGFWVGYRKCDNGYDMISNMSSEVLDGSLNWGYPSQGGFDNNVKGFEVGFETTPFPSSIFQLKYAPLKALTLTDSALISSSTGTIYGTLQQGQLTSLDRKYFVAQMTWFY